MQKAQFYIKLQNNAVQCDLCDHHCVIGEKQSGICGARLNLQGNLYSLVYGYPSGTSVDPIEKKPLYHFFPGSRAYSLGTLGCNYACKNCLNWRDSQAQDIKKMTNKMDYISPERVIEDALGNDCRSIAYTYNEPTVFAEYALEIMKLAKLNGIKNVWVSNGYMSQKCLDAIVPYLDAINVDLKSFDEDFYKNNCNGNLQAVLDNLVQLKSEQVHVEVTTLIIPTLTDDIDMLENLANFIATELDADTPWHITKFSPGISWKLRDLPETGEDLVYQAYQVGKDNGLKYVYVGNMPGDQKENTYCPQCGELAIRRMVYQIDRLDSGGRCAYCDRSLDIIE